MNSNKLFRHFLICSMVLSVNVVFAQSLAEQLTNYYAELLEEKTLRMSIDVKVWDLADKNGSPIDQSVFIYIKDKKGIYVKNMDTEIIQEDKMIIKIDDFLKRIYITNPKNEEDGSAQSLMPVMMSSFDKLDSLYSIVEKKTKEGTEYTLYKGEKNFSKFRFSKNRLIKISQYPPDKIEYKNEEILTYLEMDYRHHSAKKRRYITVVVSVSNGNLVAKKEYSKYKIFDYRNNK